MADVSSTPEPLGSLPIATAVLTAKGSIVSATNAFWQMTALGKPVTKLQELGSLGAALLRIAESDTLLQGQCTYKGPEGSLWITWHRGTSAAQPAIFCCLLNEQAWLPTATFVPQADVPTPASNDWLLPNHQAISTLLRQAIDTCRRSGVPLSLARISVLTDDKQPLFTVGHEAWRTIGRKLRAMCRVSDLVGVADNGDFLIIALNADLEDARGITRRVLGQLNAWAPGNLGRPILANAGYATLQPGRSIQPSELIRQATPVGPKS